MTMSLGEALPGAAGASSGPADEVRTHLPATPAPRREPVSVPISTLHMSQSPQLAGCDEAHIRPLAEAAPAGLPPVLVHHADRAQAPSAVAVASTRPGGPDAWGDVDSNVNVDCLCRCPAALSGRRGRARYGDSLCGRTLDRNEAISSWADVGDAVVDGEVDEDVVRYADTCWPCAKWGFPYWATPSLETVGPYDFEGRLTTAMTVHPK